jgi:hypothetical protein
MRYTVNARAQSIITAALAVLLAIAVQFSTSTRVDPAQPSSGAHSAAPHLR